MTTREFENLSRERKFLYLGQKWTIDKVMEIPGLFYTYAVSAYCWPEHGIKLEGVFAKELADRLELIKEEK